MLVHTQGTSQELVYVRNNKYIRQGLYKKYKETEVVGKEDHHVFYYSVI